MQTKHLLTYLSTAPVLAAVWMTITAGILIEFNRFYPDLLFHPL
ncbi:photosystem I reaction center subunit IX [Thermosynechococcaceae cyanobacterium Okahandja]